MRTRTLLSLAAATMLASPAAAHANFAHVVSPGESLSSVAAVDGLSVSQLASANGLSPDAELISGSTLDIPPQSGGTTDSSDTGPADSSDSSSENAAPTTSVGSGSYVVQPGDTLSAIAANAGTTVDQLAAANGVDPNGILLAGAVLNLSGAGSGSSSGSGATTEPVSTDGAGSSGAPEPTPETVSAGEVGSIAASEGVSPSLAEAIGWQESGFNNDLVSNTGAVGVMQIEPGTWDYIGQNLAGPPPLQSASAHDNIRAGTLLLHSLLSDTGGDPALTAAGYYQGLQSVQENGMYSDTQQYVNDVMALRQQFGGP
jgi:N-acetylmuramoyl-L-alanine amidase